MEIKINLTINGKFEELKIPVNEDDSLESFIISLQTFLTMYSQNTISTFDIYTLEFERIALVGTNNNYYIDEEFNDINTIGKLFDYGIDTIEVLGLGNTSIDKVLEEEKQLIEALDNYDANY